MVVATEHQSTQPPILTFELLVASALQAMLDDDVAEAS